MAIDPAALGMHDHREAHDDLGELAGWVHDLGAAWTAEQEARRVVVAEKDAGFVLDTVQAAPRDIVWAFMTDPALRPLLAGRRGGGGRASDRAAARRRDDEPLHARRRGTWSRRSSTGTRPSS